MIINKMLVIAFALLSLAMIAIGGGAILVQKSRAQDKRAPDAAPTINRKTAPPSDTPRPPELNPLIQQSINAAQARLLAQRDFYEEGRITIDRFIEACYQVQLAELRAAQTDAERNAIKERYISILKEIENRENAELVVGRGTQADLTEAVRRRVHAETELQTKQDMPSILRRLAELERKVEQLQKERAGK